MRKSYLDYAMSVIVGRGRCPMFRDGLEAGAPAGAVCHGAKLGNDLSNKAYKKGAARVVGDVIGKYHPHGDASVYDAIVRIGGSRFPWRYPAGRRPRATSGSVDGDPAGGDALHTRKCACRSSPRSCWADIDKENRRFSKPETTTSRRANRPYLPTRHPQSPDLNGSSGHRGRHGDEHTAAQT